MAISVPRQGSANNSSTVLSTVASGKDARNFARDSSEGSATAIVGSGVINRAASA